MEIGYVNGHKIFEGKNSKKLDFNVAPYLNIPHRYSRIQLTAAKLVALLETLSLHFRISERLSVLIPYT